MSITINVNIHELHVHLAAVTPAAVAVPATSVTPSPLPKCSVPQEVCDDLNAIADAIADMVADPVQEPPTVATTDAPVSQELEPANVEQEHEAENEQPITDLSPRKRGRPRKTDEQRAAEKAAEEAEREQRRIIDEDILRQAAELVVEEPGGMVEPQPAPAAIDTEKPSAEADVSGPPSAPAPTDAPTEHALKQAPHSALTGELLQPVAPDAPELAVLRDALRSSGYSSTDEALNLLSTMTDRKICRIGELAIGEVVAITEELRLVMATAQ